MKSPLWFTRITALLLLSLSNAGAAFAADSLTINGAGATFPYPIYSKWFAEYAKERPGVQINYQSIGSGGGIRQFTDGTIDFGATDAPMTDEQLSKLQAPALHIPTVLGAVVVTYNLPGVAQLKLDGPTVAGVFLGKITKWNDPKIAALNAGLKLPDEAILVTHRSDGSGTTAVFTDYLAKVSPEWKSSVGAGTAVKWPTGLGGKGNEGVTGLLKQTPGSIGYIELIYAETNKLPAASLKNKAGVFVSASPKSVSAAAAGAVKSIPEDFRVSITDCDAKDGYPISSFTYLLVPAKVTGEKGRELMAFLNWALSKGQGYAEALAYAPLPKPLVARVQKKIR